MSTHAWIEEPDQNGLKEGLKVLYNHHDKQLLHDKVNKNDNKNTWENIGQAYINVLEEIAHNGKRPARL